MAQLTFGSGERAAKARRYSSGGPPLDPLLALTERLATEDRKPSTAMPRIPCRPMSHPEDEPSNSESEQADPHCFGIEKGFWKIRQSAQELLKFTNTYQQYQAAGIRDGPSRFGALPKEIDILSMTQLSWGLLHAVSDINIHNQRLAARDDASWMGSGSPPEDGPASLSRRMKRKRTNNTTCLDCGVNDSPYWRHGPAGRFTLCNVCGLLYTKRIRGLESLSGTRLLDAAD